MFLHKKNRVIKKSFDNCKVPSQTILKAVQRPLKAGSVRKDLTMDGHVKKATLNTDVQYQLPWGGSISEKAGASILVDLRENVCVISGYHCELDPSDFSLDPV